MMHARYGNGWAFGLMILWTVHILSVIAFSIGILFLLMWVFKHLSEKKLRQWGWTLVITGSVVCLATIAVMGHAWEKHGFEGGKDGRMMPMMGEGGAGQNYDSASQTKEEADGKALYDKLQAKQSSCQDLADADFELIGEYLMGQRAGASHEQMNAMMQQMMGQKGEVQMHVIIGRNGTGCASKS